MSDNERAQKFSDALKQLDSSGEPSDLLALFAEGAELRRPELDGTQGPTTDPAQFWKAYRDQFSEISTDFSVLREAEDIAVLEWTSKATLTAGRDLTYAGVSLLTFGEDDLVTRFSTYYDTAAFVRPTS